MRALSRGRASVGAAAAPACRAVGGADAVLGGGGGGGELEVGLTDMFGTARPTAVEVMAAGGGYVGATPIYGQFSVPVRNT